MKNQETRVSRINGMTLEEFHTSKFAKDTFVTMESLHGVPATDQTPSVYGQALDPMPVKKYSYCRGITKVGNDCSAAPVKGEQFCVGHLRSIREA